MAGPFLSQDLPAQVANNSHRDTPRRAAAVLAAWLLAAHDARALLAGLRRRLGRRAA